MYGGLEVWRDVVRIATCMYGGLEVWTVEGCSRYSDVYVWMYGGMEAWEWRCRCCERVCMEVWMYGGLEVPCRCSDVYVWMDVWRFGGLGMALQVL